MAGNILHSLSCANIFRVPWLCKGRLFDPAFGTRTGRRHKAGSRVGSAQPCLYTHLSPTRPAPGLATYRCGGARMGSQRSPGGNPRYPQRRQTGYVGKTHRAAPPTAAQHQCRHLGRCQLEWPLTGHQQPTGIPGQHTARWVGKSGFVSLLHQLSHGNRQFLTQVFLKTASHLLSASVSHLCKGIMFIALFYPNLSLQATRISRQ